jgi:Zn-dependent M28 family amino/carboxypeptidase
MVSLSNEVQWQSQKERQQRIIRIMLLVIGVIILLLVVIGFWLTQPLLLRLSPKPQPSVNPTLLKAHVQKLSVDLMPRDERHHENLDRTAEYIKGELQKFSTSVSDQVFQVEGRSFRNVIAEFGPETAERVIVGAHYDAAGPYPGADDNASGIAGLIELGRLLSEQPLKTRVELVAFSLEEPPYFRTTGMGSAVHASSLKKAGVKVRMMFSLEMIGYFSDATDSQAFPAAILTLFYPSRGNFIAVVGRTSEGLLVRRVKRAMREASPLPAYSISAPSFIPGIDFSDQVNYWDAGYHAIMITDTAFYRNRNYHTQNDTAEKLDYTKMAMVVQGVFASVVDIANN